jgi:hypothetical protein
VGTVATVGDGGSTDGPQVGQRVVALTNGTGAYAEYAVAAFADVVAVPAELTPAEAAAVAVQGTTALGVLRMASVAGSFNRSSTACCPWTLRPRRTLGYPPTPADAASTNTVSSAHRQATNPSVLLLSPFGDPAGL